MHSKVSLRRREIVIMPDRIIYEIMHGECPTAQVDSQGRCRIWEPDFLPCNLYLEEAEDVETLVNNVTNFWYWCATRILTLDRQYAKEILGSIGAAQAVTDRDRAQIALSYRCVSLTDIYWVRQQGEQVTFREVNLYDNHLDSALVDVALRGRQLTAQNKDCHNKIPLIINKQNPDLLLRISHSIPHKVFQNAE